MEEEELEEDKEAEEEAKKEGANHGAMGSDDYETTMVIDTIFLLQSSVHVH